MPTLTITRGLPGSGKSTWAAEEQRRHASTVVVTRDDIRDMLHGGVYSKTNERQVNAVRDFLITDSLSRGRDTICADTNLASSVVEGLVELVASLPGDMDVAIKDFRDVPVEECIRRDSLRAKPVGPKVIRKMWQDHLMVTPTPPAAIPDAPEAIIVDVDGTVALMCDRSPYDYSKVGGDAPNQPIIELVKLQQQAGTMVIFCSGREDSCYSDTKEWLTQQGLDPQYLLMRKTGDGRRDSIVKREIYENFIQGRFNIKYVLDDRDQVVQGWRALGLTCLQVAEGAF